MCQTFECHYRNRYQILFIKLDFLSFLYFPFENPIIIFSKSFTKCLIKFSDFFFLCFCVFVFLSFRFSVFCRSVITSVESHVFRESKRNTW
jgi:hypothetical protein